VRTSVLVLLSLCLSEAFLYAQEFAYRRIAAEQGLTSEHINHIVSDSGGFVWIASNSGIYSFDGRYATHYATSNGLPANEIKRLEVAKDGKIWFLSTRGQAGYISFGEVKGLQDYPALVRRQFSSIYPDDIGGLWLASRDGALFYLKDAALLVEEQLSLPPIVSFIRNKADGKILGIPARGNTFIQIDDATLSTSPIVLERGEFRADDYGFRPRSDSNKEIILHSIDGVFLLNPSGKSLNRVISSQQLGAVGANASILDDGGINWVASGNGLYSFDSDWNVLTRVRPGLTGFVLNTVHKDHEGNLWIGSANSGLFFVHKAKMEWIQLGQLAVQNQISGVAANSSGDILIGNAEGKLFRKRVEGSVEVLTHAPVGRIRKIINNPVGDFYIASDKGLFVFQANSLRILIANYPISDVCVLPKGGWAAIAPGKLFLLTEKGGKLSEMLVGNYQSVAPALQGDGLMLASEWGISMFEGAKPEYWLNAAVYKNHGVSAILSDFNRNILWIATRGAGLLGLEGKKVKYKLSVQQGLSSNNILALHLTPDGDLLIGTDLGLNSWNPDSDPGYIDVVDESRGLVSNHIRTVTSIGDSILAGTNEGLFLFAQQTHKPGKSVLPFHLISLTLNGEEVRKPRVTIPYGANQLTFRFVALSYADPKGISYTYQMKGLDQIEQQSFDGQVTYSRMPPGKYLFTATAKNRNGELSPMQIQFPVEILPAYYQTFWFKALLVLLLSIVFFILYLRRIAHVKRKEEEKSNLSRQMNELKLTALKAQMNPHFLFNSLGSIQHLINSGQKSEANTYLTRFAKLLRVILDQSDERLVSLKDTIILLELYLELEALRFSGAFSYQILLPQDESQAKLLSMKIPPMILQPFVENAIKHGLLPKQGDAKLFIRFELKEQDMLYCEVHDNGIGREQREVLKQKSQAEHTSKGIENSRQRLRLMSEIQGEKLDFTIQDLYDANGSPAGTKVTCMIPVGL
jgi:ligand-binding sensor domain-containing protein